MFEHLDYTVSEEHRKDLIHQAASARLIRSLEIPRRRKKNRHGPGLWLLGALSFFRHLANHIASAIANSHDEPHRRTHTL
jgi:hypothetical protein